MPRMIVTYRVRSDAAAIGARAAAIAVEQSVEMPVTAISDETVLKDIVGEAIGIRETGSGVYDVNIALSTATMGNDPGQLLNMLFGNSSLQETVRLVDAELSDATIGLFGGPRHGIEGLRRRCGAAGRALTCSALKPQGLSPAGLADIAYELALGGIDFIKDDHGLADQAYSPFAGRVEACAGAVRRANRETGFRTHYAPNISGDLDAMREQLSLAAAEGVDTALIEPMICGVSNFHRLVKDFPAIAFIAHPAMAGPSHIAPPLLLGKLFRLFGADVTVYPNYGGRFSYSKETCLRIAEEARRPCGNLKPCLPAPAGGMTLDRVPELLDFYGKDTMLLIGGSLLAAKDRLRQETSAFVSRAASYFQG